MIHHDAYVWTNRHHAREHHSIMQFNSPTAVTVKDAVYVIGLRSYLFATA